jgi:protein-S-isoprenylcysteine O-methyltransferase Ste14
VPFLQGRAHAGLERVHARNRLSVGAPPREGLERSLSITRNARQDFLRRLHANGMLEKRSSRQWYDPKKERFLPDRAAIEREGRGMFAIRFVGFFILIALLVFYALNPSWMQVLLIPFPPWLRWLGFCLGLASLALMAWTQVELGTQWSAQLQLREEHHLVTTGPYARVRHPMYTAMFGWGIALALVTAHWIFVVLAVLSIAGLIARVPREEQMMLEEFGGEYWVPYLKI